MRFKVAADCRETTSGDGVQLIPGQFIELSPEQREQPFNQHLIESGALLPVSAAGEREVREMIEEGDG